MLTGLVSLYLHWNSKTGFPPHVPLVLACVVTRAATFRAFSKYKLGFMTSKALPEVTEFSNFLLGLRDNTNIEGFEYLK